MQLLHFVAGDGPGEAPQAESDIACSTAVFCRLAWMFRELLRFLPDDAGMAYVLVQHLDPRHESLLPDLLARVTRMEVHEARAGMVVAVNQVYVIAPNTDMTLSQGMLHLVPRTEAGGQHLSIDTFLRSLAESRASGAFGVILSRTAADGTLGLQAIKAAGA